MQSNKKVITNKCLDEANIQFIAHILNSLLDENKISTKALSEATGISIALINNLKRAEGNPTIGTLKSICNFFNISLSELLGLSNVNDPQKNVEAISLFDLRFCHEKSEENSFDKMLIEIPKNIMGSDLFGIVINNNALLPLYEKGTIFIATSTPISVDGDIVIARIQNRSNFLKRLFIKKNIFHLKNINIDDTIESFNKDDIEILGVVIQIIQKII